MENRWTTTSCEHCGGEIAVQYEPWTWHLSAGTVNMPVICPHCGDLSGVAVAGSLKTVAASLPLGLTAA